MNAAEWNVFLVSLKIAFEHLFFVCHAEIQNGQEERYEKERPP
jgi:hypothetical protein